MKKYKSKLSIVGELKNIRCPKCNGHKISFSFIKRKITECSLCNGTGKYNVFCYIGNDYLSND